MKCPYCTSKRDKVVDSRTIRSNQAVRRRRTRCVPTDSLEGLPA